MGQIRRRLGQVGPGRPLLPVTARPWALLLASGCAALTVVVGVLVAHQHIPVGIDHAIDVPVYTSLGPHHELLLRIVGLGSPLPVIVLSILIVAGCLLAGRLNGAILGVLAAPLADGLDELVLKPLFHRADLGFLSYPSGHTTAVFALGSTVTVLLAVPAAGVPRAMMRRVLIPVAGGLIGVAVAVGLIALRWHYFSDTVGGAAVAIATVCVLALLLDAPAARRALARIAPGPARDALPDGPGDGAADLPAYSRGGPE
ncbi:MAG: phosphatase PAP2 family protein [Streptosporangiaceae bacterium]